MDKIQNYQKQIDHMLHLNKGRSIERYESNIKDFLKLDLAKGKISETEYSELMEYMQGRILEIKKEKDNAEKDENIEQNEKENNSDKLKDESERNINNIEKRGTRAEFVEELKVLKPIIMYKGRIRQTAPTRQERKERGME